MKSWRGICRLFAAVLVARPPPGFTQRPKHLNPKLLWITIVGVARRIEYLDLVTPVSGSVNWTILHGSTYCRLSYSLMYIKRHCFLSQVLHGLLEVGGYVLLQVFGHQAQRLFRSVLKSIENSVTTEQLALSTCLELLLDPTTATENGYGVLLEAFWS